MGLFVTRDGEYQGWLAALLCCCAAVNEDEAPIEIERGRSKPSIQASHAVCNAQPQPLQDMPRFLVPHDSSTVSTKDDEGFDEARNQRPRTQSSERPPSLKPLELGSSNLLGRRPSHGTKQNAGHSTRPSVTSPSGFRRLDNSECPRQGLIPLRLGPIRLSPAPEESDQHLPLSSIASPTQRARSDSTQELLTNTQRASSQPSRQTPFDRCQRRSSSVPAPAVANQPVNAICSSPAVAGHPLRPSTSRQSSSSSLRKQALESGATTPRMRPSTESARTKRKHSNQSLRRTVTSSGDPDLDREILELNTIVEERRLEASRRKGPQDHIPAVAPSMQVRARSETLNSIGSAFTKPATARQQPSRILTDFSTIEESASTRQPLNRSTSRASTRVSGWLSGLLTTSSSTTHVPTQEPFYKCRPTAGAMPSRPHSQSSLCSSLSEIESPSLTAASSPTATTKGHSRSLTAESRITPLSPASMYGQLDTGKRNDGAGGGGGEERWVAVNSPTSQVGLAF